MNNNVGLLERLEQKIDEGRRGNLMNIEEANGSLVLTPENGHRKSGEPYFFTLKEEDFVMLPQNMFMELLELLHSSYEDQFCMQLEREIAKQMPRDFDDIWEIAFSEIKKSKKSFLKTDPKWLVALIKKQHPNLFIHFDSELWGQS